MTESNHKLAAIVFTDIVGYTRQMEEDEHRTMQLLQKQRDIVSPIVKSYNGEIIKELGDGLLMMFGSAVEAVRCAITIQSRLFEEELTIRAGIHIGEVIFKDGDVFGSAVNAAARIQPLASANGVCISEAVKNQIQNQTDIRLHSIGMRELKGMKEPVEIFEVIIEGVTQIKKKNLRFVINKLWSRRVFQVTAIYLAAAWLIRMAVSSYVTGKLLSPHLVDLTWIILLSFLPTVILLTYFHGYRSSGKWTRAELIGFPSNMVLSILLIIFLFNGKDLGAATTSVTIEDENGQKTERTILKNEFRKKTLVFFFDNKSADTSLNWLQYAMPNLIEYDASQDIFLEIQGTGNYIQKFKALDYKNGLGTPLIIKKKIAGDMHKNTFMTGSFNFAAGKYTVSTQLYNTETGRLIAENQYSGEDLFSIVDEVTTRLKKDLGIPAGHIEETADLPVSEIYTGSVKALEYMTKGYLDALLNNNWPSAIQYTENAIAEDKNFIYAHQQMIGYCLNNNLMDKALSHAEITMANIDKLIEREQFAAKYSYYYLNQYPDKIQTICQNWVNFYPDDITAHNYLVVNYLLRNKKDEAIQECRTILSIDPEQNDWIMVLGNLYMGMAKYDSAEYYFNLFAKKFPTDFKSYQSLGDLYVAMSEFSKAKENFEKASSIEYGNVDVMLSLSDVNIKEGNFAEAINIDNKALTSAKTALDSAKIYFDLDHYYKLRGQMKVSLDYFEKGMYKLASNYPPFTIKQRYLLNIDKLVLADKSEDAFKLLKSLEKDFQPPFDKVVSIGYLRYYIEINDADKADKYVSDVLELIKSLGQENLLVIVDQAKGRIAEIRKDYKSALDSYSSFSQRQPGEYQPYQWMSRCQRELGNIKEAQADIERALKQHPFDPESNYEACMVYLKLNDKQKAKECIDRTLDIWKDADASYVLFQQALTAKKQLGDI
jgi:class 3 adenylate cyclase/tetratricopeptide (TPR) repeat protein